MSNQRVKKRSISAKQEYWNMAEYLVSSKEFNSISEVVQKGIELLYEKQRGTDIMNDEKFDRKLMASLQRIQRGEAVFYTKEQVDERLNQVATERRITKRGNRQT